MKIVYCCADPGVPAFGHKGCSLHIQEMLRAMGRKANQLVLLSNRPGGPPPEDLGQVIVEPLPELPKGDDARRELAALAANRDLALAMRAHGDCGLYYERYSLWSYAGLQAAHLAGIPTVLEVNAPLIDEQRRYRSLHNPDIAYQCARKAFAASEVIAAVSAEVAQWLDTFAETRGKVHVVPNGVNTHRFSPEVPASLPACPGEFTVGFVGNLRPWHGVENLLEGFALLVRLFPASRLLVVGNGPELEHLKKRAREWGIAPRVAFVGAVAPDRVPGLLTSMDVAVAPYPDLSEFYFSPLKVYEYMAAGRPVVASRIGQLEGLIEHGYDGLLCEAGNPQSLADALAGLKASPARRGRMGRRARAKVCAHHTWNAVADRVLRLATPHRRWTGISGTG